MRDSKGELSSVFDWVDIRSNTLNSKKVDKKKVKELQGSISTSACKSGRQVVIVDHHGLCTREYQTAYSCFYNSSNNHPFIGSKDDYSYYFAHLYPHLGKLEHFSK